MIKTPGVISAGVIRKSHRVSLLVLLSISLGCAARGPGSDAGALNRLRTDILAATRQPGVARASWGIVVDSLDRQGRLVDVNSGTLFVPA